MPTPTSKKLSLQKLIQAAKDTHQLPFDAVAKKNGVGKDSLLAQFKEHNIRYNKSRKQRADQIHADTLMQGSDLLRRKWA